MSTKPKSFSLLIIVVIAIVLFITAIIMKQISPDNSEVVTDSKDVLTKQIVKTHPSTKEIATPVASIIDEIVANEPEQIPSPGTNAKMAPSEQVKKDNRAKLEKKLNMHLMLKTPEKIIAVIEALKKQGRDDEANEYIEYLLKKFPDYDFQ